MTITIFGATGMVGKHLVKQALYMNHSVIAFGRNVYTAGFPEHDNLQLVQGALFDETSVFAAVKKTDAVLSVVGGAKDGLDKTRSYGMKNMIKQMQKAKIKRIIALGGLGILSAPDDSLLLDSPDYPEEYIPVGMEHLRAYEYLKNSNLQWSFVCAPDISDKEVTGRYYTNADYLPENNKFSIHAGDLAMFMLKELEKNEYIQKRVGISN